MKIKSIVACLVIILSSFYSFSQTIQPNCQSALTGKVIDDHDGTDLSYSTLYIIESKIGVSANFKGEYKIENLCLGNFHIIISHIGCTPDTIEVRIDSKLVYQDFKLEHHAEELKEVQVASFKRERRGVTSSEIDPIEKQEVMQSIASIASTVNGVNLLQNGANVSKPIIHGLHSNRVAIVNNGMTLEGQNWGEEHAPELDPFTVDQLKVVKGASALKYGAGAIGGALISSPKQLPDTAGISGLLFLGGSSNNRKGAGSLRLEGKFDQLPKFSWAVQGSLKKSGSIQTPNYNLNNTGTEEFNYSWQLGYQKNRFKSAVYYSQINSEIGIFSGAHIGNLTDLEEAISRSEPREEDKGDFSYSIDRPYQHVEHETIQWQTSYELKTAGKLELLLARQFNIREEYDKHLSRGLSADEEDLPEFAVNLETYQAQLGWKLPQMKQIETEIGGKFQTQDNVLKGSRSFIPAYVGDLFGVYLISNWKKGLWSIDGGLRIDNSSMEVTRYINRTYQDESVDFTTLAASIEGNVLLSEHWTLGLNATFAQRAPGINELFSSGLHHGVAALEYGDADLSMETSYKFSGSAIYQTDKMTIDGLVYSNLINDFIYLQPDGTSLTVRGAFPVFRYQQSNALLNGADLALKYNWTSAFSINAKSSLLWAQNRSSDEALIFMPANRIGGGVKYQFKSDRKIKEPWIGFGFNHVFEQKRVPKGVDFASPPKAYTLFQINSGILLPIKNQQIEIGITIDNVFNTAYRDYMNRFRYYADEMGRNVSLSLKVPFTVMK